MAQAVANHALSGEANISFIVAATAGALFDWKRLGRDPLADCGARVEQMPVIARPGEAVGEVIGRTNCVLEGGSVDAFAEQLVAGATGVGDVLVILGTTLIVWTVVPEAVEVPNYYAMPNTAAGTYLVGGPSNAGGLFLNWAMSLFGDAPGEVDPARVPVWVPYPRGERVPLQDPDRRGQLVDLDLTHGPSAARRAALEATAFAARRMIDASPVPARRIVATGGGTRLEGWVEALADCTGLPGARVRGSRRGCARLGVPCPARVRARDVDDRRRSLEEHGARRRPVARRGSRTSTRGTRGSAKSRASLRFPGRY